MYDSFFLVYLTDMQYELLLKNWSGPFATPRAQCAAPGPRRRLQLAHNSSTSGGKLSLSVSGGAGRPSVVFSTDNSSKYQSEPSDNTRLQARRRNTGRTVLCGPGTGSAPHRARRKTTGARFGCCVATIGCVLYSFQLAIAPRNKSNPHLQAGGRE